MNSDLPMNHPDARFKRLAEQWFLTEPAFFALFCTHALTLNPGMPCALRTGKGRIEYNPELLAREPSDAAFEELVGIEMLRLFLKHPYERTPGHCPRTLMKAASDITLTAHYRFGYHLLPLARDYDLPGDKHYEWYLTNLQAQQGGPPPPPDDTAEPMDMLRQGAGEPAGAPGDKAQSGEDEGGEGNSPGEPPQEAEQETGGGTTAPTNADEEEGAPAARPAPTAQEQNAAVAELWEEDPGRAAEINELISTIKTWGSIPGQLVETIIASTRARIDYRKVLAGFRASIISNTRRLTRMQPNRRTGFDYMGSRREFSTRLLLAVDVSCSISSPTLRHFYGIISKFFKYGIKSIDVIQFDCAIQGEPQTFSEAKKMKPIKVYGRGGTNFNPVFRYVEEHRQYDGLIILTDGDAPPPPRKPRGRTRVAWVCESRASYNVHHEWMEKLGKACHLNLN